MRRRTDKQAHLRLLRLELLADAHSRSKWRAGYSARLKRAALLQQAVRARLKALVLRNRPKLAACDGLLELPGRRATATCCP
jgi:hypothetical protein